MRLLFTQILATLGTKFDEMEENLKARQDSSGIFMTFLWPISPLAVFWPLFFFFNTCILLFLTRQTQGRINESMSKRDLSTALPQSSTITIQ